MTHRYHSHALRKGRFSQQGRPYLVTFSTAGRSPWFSRFSIACQVCRSIAQSDIQNASHTWCYVVMPDHVHWLLSTTDKHDLSQIVRMAKARVSRSLEQAIWQSSFHDRALRSEAELKPAARYVIANPVRAGLVASVRDYPFWNAAWL
ncbi:transposase [Alcanivorax sp. VBW004]|uniref:REP-associated tyrosine transposase n=1 Tax=Alcanivorax sp. VBW004 TaxID=1287708 RepID=UPI0012BBE085|nr:transposase [Alcanivorax sp. VBW004]MTT52788.1 transposase [Alcanivorax sp. VBW004]